MNANEIRLARKPKMKMFAPTQVVAGFEIKWDERIQAWEMAKPNPMLGGIYSFRIGRVVNGKVFITEMVTDLEPSVDEISIAAADALAKVGEVMDLGDWEQDEEESDSESLGGSVVIAVAETLLKNTIALNRVGNSPADEHIDEDFNRLAKRLRHGSPSIGDSFEAGVSKDLAEAFIENALIGERDLAEHGNVVRGPLEHRVVLMRNGDGGITADMGLAVYQKSGPILVVNLEKPIVNELVLASQDCSLADRVRVFSELVFLYYQFIRSAGGVPYVSRNLVGFAREAVGVLAVVTAEYRDSQGGHQSDGSN